MRVRPTDPSAVLRYPNDPKRVLPIEGGNVPDDSIHWNRRLRAREIEIVPELDKNDDHTPTGREPVAPLTVR
jgi:hypothetical protein